MRLNYILNWICIPLFVHVDKFIHQIHYSITFILPFLILFSGWSHDSIRTHIYISCRKKRAKGEGKFSGKWQDRWQILREQDHKHKEVHTFYLERNLIQTWSYQAARPLYPSSTPEYTQLQSPILPQATIRYNSAENRTDKYWDCITEVCDVINGNRQIFVSSNFSEYNTNKVYWNSTSFPFYMNIKSKLKTRNWHSRSNPSSSSFQEAASLPLCLFLSNSSLPLLSPPPGLYHSHSLHNCLVNPALPHHQSCIY